MLDTEYTVPRLQSTFHRHWVVLVSNVIADSISDETAEDPELARTAFLEVEYVMLFVDVHLGATVVEPTGACAGPLKPIFQSHLPRFFTGPQEGGGGTEKLVRARIRSSSGSEMIFRWRWGFFAIFRTIGLF